MKLYFAMLDGVERFPDRNLILTDSETTRNGWSHQFVPLKKFTKLNNVQS